uniref:60S ribosomal protein L29-like n=1 Tax=Nyctereutes procyonoides TaxID=34880 RepID=UPI002443CC6C|nr:60S ribosomal protein L29-like [Nyctereutes procyonoides]
MAKIITKKKKKNGKKAQSQRYKSLNGADPKFLRNMRFAKKHNKKGLEKMQAHSTKAMTARAEAKALVKSKEIKPKIPTGGSPKLNRLAYTAHPKLGERAHARIAKGLRLCWPKAQGKAQTKAQAAAATPAPAPALSSAAQAPKGPRPPPRLQCWASMCTGLVSSCAVCTNKPAAVICQKKKKKEKKKEKKKT